MIWIQRRNCQTIQIDGIFYLKSILFQLNQCVQQIPGTKSWTALKLDYFRIIRTRTPFHRNVLMHFKTVNLETFDCKDIDKPHSMTKKHGQKEHDQGKWGQCNIDNIRVPAILLVLAFKKNSKALNTTAIKNYIQAPQHDHKIKYK